MWRMGLFVVVLVAGGCRSGAREVQQRSLEPLQVDYGRFSSSAYQAVELPARSGRRVSVRFDDVPLGRALATLSDETGEAIVWSEGLDGKRVSGFFEEAPLGLVLDSLARRLGAEVNDLDGVFFVGPLGPDDLASAVVAMPPGDVATMEATLLKLVSGKGKLVVLGGSIWIRDTAQNVSKILRELERYREAACRRYLAEVFLIRCKQGDLLDVAAKLQVESIDLLTGPNLKALFNVLLEADASFGGAQVLERPLLQLAEGQVGRLHVGRTVMVATKSVSNEGTVTTTGYDSYEDGLQLELRAYRAAASRVALTFSLEVSEFEDVESDGVPRKDSEELQGGVVVGDGEVCLLGALGRDIQTQQWKLVGWSGQRTKETVLVWLRVRELASGIAAEADESGIVSEPGRKQSGPARGEERSGGEGRNG